MKKPYCNEGCSQLIDVHYSMGRKNMQFTAPEAENNPLEASYFDRRVAGRSLRWSRARVLVADTFANNGRINDGSGAG